MDENRKTESAGQEQAIRDLHHIMLEAMRSREGEILRFLGFLLPALAAFLAFGWFTSKKSAVSADLLLPASAILAIVILAFGAWYGLALSYNYRYLVIVCYWLQKKLDLLRYLPDWKPKKLSRKKCLTLELAPEMVRAHVWLFVTLIAVVVVGYWFLTGPNGIDRNCIGAALITALGALSLGLVFWAGAVFYPNKFHKLIKDAEANYQKVSDSAP